MASLDDVVSNIKNIVLNLSNLVSGQTSAGQAQTAAIQAQTASQTTDANNIVAAINAEAAIIKSVFPQQTGTATSATAGSATLPANPVGFIVVSLPGGTSVKVPYYGG